MRIRNYYRELPIQEASMVPNQEIYQRVLRDTNNTMKITSNEPMIHLLAGVIKETESRLDDLQKELQRINQTLAVINTSFEAMNLNHEN